MNQPMENPGARPRTRPVERAIALVRELVAATLLALTATLFFNVFIAQAVTIDQGPSMQPNLYVGYRVLIEKMTYRSRLPARGEVVVVAQPGEQVTLIKRVVALPGEIVTVRDGHTWINGSPIQEPWVSFWGGPSYPPTLVPPGHIFILGDNRGSSRDSRMIGPVPLDAVQGRAFFVYWPFERMQLIR